MELVDTQRVRILLLHNFLSPYRIPLFEALAGRFDLDVWILGDIRAVRDWPAEAPGAGFRMRLLPHLTIPLGSRYNVILINPTLPVEIARHKPDIIICCAWDTPATFYAALHARLAGIPFILWSGSTAAEDTALRRLTRPVVRMLVRSAAAWLAYGTRAKEYLASLGASPEKTFLAYNTVDTAAFSEASARAASGAAAFRAQLGVKTGHVAMYCGNLLDLKGVGDLIEAFAEVARARDDITLLLVGNGKQEAAYRARVAALGLTSRVLFTGFVQRDNLPAYYAATDVLVLPSHSEVWGLVINEALACGVPVIATDVCGATQDLIRPGVNGAIVPSRDRHALAQAILSFFDSPAIKVVTRAAARESIAPFTIANTADAFVAAVRSALDSMP